MNRGAGGQRVFFTRADGERFESFLEQASSRGTVELHAYCLMPNHFHLLLHCPDAGLSEFMQYVVSGYTRFLNRQRRRDGPLFRSRFRAVPMDGPEQLAWAGRYIHLNPIDLQPTPDPVTYRWSSLRGYADAGLAPPWLRRDALLGMFDSGVSGYLDFVLSGGAPSVDALLSAIEHAVDERIDADPNVRRGLVRSVQLALVARLPDDLARRLDARLRFPDAESRQNAVERAHRRIAESAELGSVIDSLARFATGPSVSADLAH